MTHTPGPWRVDQDGTSQRWGMFAGVPTGKSDEYDWTWFSEIRLTNPDDADLVAAAPDLLDALGQLLSCSDHHEPCEMHKAKARDALHLAGGVAYSGYVDGSTSSPTGGDDGRA